MADRRYRKGVFIGNPKPSPQLESPLSYGWQRAGYSTLSGAQLFQLDEATMRRVLPKDKLLTGWIVKIEGQVCPIHYTGSLREITADVQREIKIHLQDTATQF